MHTIQLRRPASLPSGLRLHNLVLACNLSSSYKLLIMARHSCISLTCVLMTASFYFMLHCLPALAQSDCVVPTVSMISLGAPSQLVIINNYYYQNPLNLTRLPPNKNVTEAFNQLSLTCQVVGEIEEIASFNSSTVDAWRHVQLQAMVITGAQVKENICDWVSDTEK